MGGDHGSIGGLVKLNAEVIEPLDRLGGVADELGEQLALGSEMAAAEGVEEVDGGRIVLLVGSLDAAFGHHSVGVADAELGDDHRLGARVVGFDGRGSARAAAADDEDVNVIFDVGEVDILRLDAAVGLEELAELMRDLLALVGADLQGGEFALFIVGMVGREQVFLLFGRHAGGLVGDIRLAGSFHRL